MEIEVSAPRVFGFVAAEWETDLAFAGGRTCEWAPAHPARLRTGFRATCRGTLVALPGHLELDVRDYVEPRGWTAHTTSGAPFTWAWCFTEHGRACRATQTCVYHPRGWRAQVAEWVIGRRRRTARVNRSLKRLKLMVEREESLERLRDSNPAHRVALDPDPQPNHHRGPASGRGHPRTGDASCNES